MATMNIINESVKGAMNGMTDRNQCAISVSDTFTLGFSLSRGEKEGVVVSSSCTDRFFIIIGKPPSPTLMTSY